MKNAAIVLLLAAAAGQPAAADPPTATIIVAPTDFATHQARAMLDRRIRNAIESACGSYASIESYQWPEMDSCWQAAKTQVSEKLANVRSEFGSGLASK